MKTVHLHRVTGLAFLKQLMMNASDSFCLACVEGAQAHLLTCPSSFQNDDRPAVLTAADTRYVSLPSQLFTCELVLTGLN
jgi:hypothetical protein